MGSIPVTACCPKKPRIESMARAVLDLLQLQLLETRPLAPLGPAGEVEDAPRVPRLVVHLHPLPGDGGLEALAAGVLPVEVALRLDPAHREDLDDKQGLVVRVVLEERGLQPGDARARPLEPGVGQQARHQPM